MPDTEFEQAFADMSYTRLQDEGQALLPYNVGFEIVDKNEQGSKALGIYVFKIGKLLAYAPSHYINGNVKPMVSLYLPKEDLFLPLTDDQVNDLLKEPAMDLGSPSSGQNISSFAQPSLENLITPPRTGRYVSASERNSNIKIFLKRLEKRASTPRKLKDNILIDFCKNNPGYGSRFFHKNKSLIKKAADFDLLDDLLKAMKNNFTHHLKKSESLKHTKGKFIEEKDNLFIAHARELSPNKKKKALRDKFIVVEDGDTTQQLYSTEYSQSFQNPQRSGMYLVLTKDGMLEPCIVFLNPKSLDDFNSAGTSLVVTLDRSKYCTVQTKDIFVTRNLTVDECKSFFSKGKNFSGVKPGKIYFMAAQFSVVFKSGKCSEPFRVTNKVSTIDSGRYLSVEKELSPLLPEDDDYNNDYNNDYNDSNGMNWLMRTKRKDSSETHGGRYDMKIYVTDSTSEKLVQNGTGLIASSKYLFFELPRCDDEAFLELGDEGTLNTSLRYRNGFKVLKVRSDNSEHYASLDDSPWKSFLKKSEMAKHFSKVGFNKMAIDRVFDDLAKSKEVKYLTKLSFFEPTTQLEGGGGLPTQLFREEYRTLPQNVQTMQPQDMGIANNMYLGPNGSAPSNLPSDAAALGDSLAQFGDRNLFEHGILGALATTSSTIDKVGTYIPDLTAAVDKLGRILFLFWYKAEDFKKIYQVNEYTKYEDLLVNTFKNLGDIVLSLKKKAIPKNLGLGLAGAK